MYICHPQIEYLKEILRKKIIGDIIFIESSFGFDTNKVKKNSRLYDPNLGGGSILDVGIYSVSISRLISAITNNKKLINPNEVIGRGLIGKTGVDEVAHADLKFSNNISAKISSAIRLQMKNNVAIKGTKGSCTEVG